MLTLLGRPRGTRRALSSSMRVAVAETLERGPERHRILLGLLLVERLSPAEVAGVLRISVSRVERSYREIMSELRRVAEGGAAAATRLGRLPASGERLRKAS